MNKNPEIHAKPKMRRTDIFITKLQYKKVMEMANKKGITFSEMFRYIVDRYLEENEKA